MDDVVSLTTEGEALLALARESGSGRAARQVYAATGLRAVLLGLRAGASLADHTAPGPATLQCLAGHAVLRAGDRQWELPPGAHAAVPAERHGVDAHDDCVLLLTVAAGWTPEPVAAALDGHLPSPQD